METTTAIIIGTIKVAAIITITVIGAAIVGAIAIAACMTGADTSTHPNHHRSTRRI